MATVRQQIVDQLKAQLEAIGAGITVTLHGGASHTFSSSIGDNVAIWRTKPMASGESWLVVIRDLNAPKDKGAPGAEMGRNLHALRVRVDLYVRDALAASDARAMLADLTAAIGVDPKLGGLARWTGIEEDALEVDDTGQRIAGASLTLTVTYKTNLWQM